MLNGFIDLGSDEATCQFIEKSQKQVYVPAGVGPNGKRHKGYTKTVEVSDKADVKAPRNKRQTAPKGSQPVPWKSGDPLPEHLSKVAIPPAWTDVKVNPSPKAKVWATGKDSQGRQQFIYNPEHTKRQKQAKFNRVQLLASLEPDLIKIIDGLQQENPDAADCLNLIRCTGMRPGSTRDTKAKVEARGATTLKGENVIVDGDKVFVDFIGKKGVHQNHEIQDKSVADMLVKRKQQSGDKGDLFDTTDVKLRAIMKKFGEANPDKDINFTTKDLRTLKATNTAKELLSKVDPSASLKEFKKVRNEIGDKVCAILGNTRTMALNSYIAPSVFEQWCPSMYAQWEKA